MPQRLFQIKPGRGWLLVAAWLLLVVPVGALEIGSSPPDFELPGLNGGTVRLSDFRGRPIVLKLATTWCPSCKAQVKELAQARQALEKHQAAVIEVYVDESTADVRADLVARPHDYPSAIAVDDGRVVKKYSLLGIPRVLLIDREFHVVRDRGLLAADDLVPLLESMVAK